MKAALSSPRCARLAQRALVHAAILAAVPGWAFDQHGEVLELASQIAAETAQAGKKRVAVADFSGPEERASPSSEGCWRWNSRRRWSGNRSRLRELRERRVDTWEERHRQPEVPAVPDPTYSEQAPSRGLWAMWCSAQWLLPKAGRTRSPWLEGWATALTKMQSKLYRAGSSTRPGMQPAGPSPYVS